MKQFLKYIVKETQIGPSLLRAYMKTRNRIVPQRILAKRKLEHLLGYEPNLVNPTTFNEKIQWLKLYDRTPLHTECADKYAVRNYVERKLGREYLIPLVFQTRNVNDIISENIPDYPIIIKTNHDSSGGIIVYDKSQTDWDAVRHALRKKLRRNYYYGKGEWQYKNIRRCVIAEKLLTDENGDIPVDYKLFCFNGKTKVIQVDIDRHTDHKRNMYDEHWNLLNCKYIYENGPDIVKPSCLTKMISLAETIAEDFTFVRVDFYNIGEKTYFGEITFHPESGSGRFVPAGWDKKFGELLHLPRAMND